MRPKLRILIAILALGSVSSGVAVAGALLVWSGSMDPSDTTWLVAFGALAGLGASVPMFPFAWGAATLLAAARVRSRLPYAATGMGLAGLAGWLLIPDPPPLGPFGFILTLVPGTSGAVCGDLYWRMAVKPQLAGSRSDDTD